MPNDLRIGLTCASVYGIIIIKLGSKKSRKLVEFSLWRRTISNTLGDFHEIYDTIDSASGEWNIYIDGVAESTMTIDTNPLDADDGPVFIGRDTCCDGRFGDAVIDEVAIFSVALSEGEIQMMMEKGLSALLLTPVEPEGKLSTTWANVKQQY